MMFRRHMQDIRQRMDHFEQLVEVKGHKDLRDLVVLDAVVEVEIDSSKGNLQFTIYNFTNVRRGITSWLSNH